MTEKGLQGKWVLVQISWEFELTEFELARFYCSKYPHKNKEIQQRPFETWSVPPGVDKKKQKRSPLATLYKGCSQSESSVKGALSRILAPI